MSERKLKNCHIEEGQSPDVNISAISPLSYVRESTQQDTLLSGSELDNLSNLPHLNPLLARRGNIMIIYFLSLLFPFTSHATCTPTPDCASIGYTETSCETDYLACPFDSTKLKCIPCDSSFRYECSGDNITGGTGSTCGGKYVSCQCDYGYVFSNASCVCDKSCIVGAIYYSDGTCNFCLDSTKTPVGVVVKDNSLIMSIDVTLGIFGGQGTDIETLENKEDTTAAKADFNGKINTALIVSAHKNLGATADNSAAIYCSEYAPAGMENTKGQWYLPAAGELINYTYHYRSMLKQTYEDKLGWNDFLLDFITSSEISATGNWYVNIVLPSMGQGKKGVIDDHIICFWKI